MKLIFTFLVILLISLSGYAQVKPIYFIGDSITTDQTKATAYGVSGKLSSDSLYVLKIFDLYDNLIQTGFYKDEKLTIAHGKFLVYADIEDFNYEYDTNFYIKDKQRFLFGQGNCVDGKKVGRWIQFYPDGKILSITNYLQDLKQGEYKLFDKKGKVEISGNYQLGLKNGEWNYDTGKKEIYANDILTYKKDN